MSTGGSGGRRYRWGRAAAPLLLLVPLLAVTAASAPDEAQAGPRAAAAGEGRIAFAGTRHRSLGRVTTATDSTPLFGPGPAHMDVQPAALGDRLVFASRRDEPAPQIYLRTADGAVHRLTSGLDAANPRLTPDGRAVVFDAAPRDGGQRDIWRVGTDGAGLARLTETPANEVHPTVSPEGRRLAYVSDADPVLGRQVYVRPMNGGAARLVSDPTHGTASEPVWNPVDDAENRDVIAYTATGPDGPRLKWTDGVAKGQLLSGAQAKWRTHGAAWLPDGNGLLFLSPDRTCDCEGDWNHVFRVDAHSEATPKVELSEDREISEVTWLGPVTGGGAVVERTSAAGPHVVTLQDARPDGADPRDLNVEILKEDPAADTNTDPAKDPLFQPAKGSDPWTERQSYTPDGRRIVVTRFEGTADRRIERIWMVDADGTHEAPLPLAGRGPGDRDTDPAFSPDGRLLAFTRMSPDGTGGTGGVAWTSRILVADAASGAIRGEIVPPAGQPRGGDAQPAWSSDGTTLAFTRNLVINGNGGNKHVWTVPVDRLDRPDRQRDLSAAICPGDCEVIDDSPAFSPDGTTIALNRKSGGGRLDERNGIVLTSLTGDTCRVLLPGAARDVPGACRRELPENPGPFQPRDAAWTADAKSLIISVRPKRAPNSPEKLKRVDVATGELVHLTVDLPGRQKEPAVQQSVDLAVEAPAALPPVTAGETATARVNVVNHGPAASPGTRLTVAPPTGLTVTALTAPGAACDPAALTCVLGIVPPGTTIPVTVTFTGLVPGDQPVDWTVTGTVLDPNPGDNTGRTVVPVREAPTPTPTTPTPTPSTPTPPKPTTAPPPPPAPLAGPGVRVSAQPDPGYVGGRVVVTYTVRNGRDALATGLRLRVGLPPGVPHDGPPPGCDASWSCALPDLVPGAGAVVQVVLRPDRALTGRVTGRLTTSGTDADPGDNTAERRIRILQPRIVAVPPIGKPGFVTSVRGKDFPPGVPVKLTWKPGITAAAAPTVPRRDGTFAGQLLILTKDQTGPRTITASGPGFSPVKTDFLVVSGTVQPPDTVTRR
ncbi:hypothetical protein [Streptomyces sp. NPDC059071]|uniref:hypothetical protein n=1 Tax=unclassified Streptomyces TaxID=2593676 RepID=UPI003669A58E